MGGLGTNGKLGRKNGAGNVAKLVCTDHEYKLQIV